MRLAVVAAGFTPGEADQLRRAMGAWRRRGVMEMFRVKLLDGMRNNGYSEEFAARVFRQIQGFGEYGFPESHAAAFALLVYVSAWLKRHHPAAFAAALVNSQPMGFYAPAQLIKNAQQHGVEIRPIDVNASDWDCTLEQTDSGPAIRLGMRLIRGFRQVDAESLVVSRGQNPFQSFDDLATRTRLSSAALTRLAKADAFRSLPLGRRPALWKALPSRDEYPLFARMEEPETPVELPTMTPYQEVLADYGAAGLSLRPHPMSFLRDRLDRLKVTPAAKLAEMKTGRVLRVAGVVLLRQRPSTAKGITFVTLEDETGMINLIVRPEVWERYRKAARGAIAMLVTGYLQNEAEIIHVLTTRIDDLSGQLAELVAPSRDFR
jgi:error-prone DNA polymerase